MNQNLSDQNVKSSDISLRDFIYLILLTPICIVFCLGFLIQSLEKDISFWVYWESNILSFLYGLASLICILGIFIGIFHIALRFFMKKYLFSKIKDSIIIN